MTLMVNCFSLNTDKFNKGSFALFSRQIKNIHVTNPVLPQTIVFQFPYPQDGISLNISNKAKLQYNTSIRPEISNVGLRILVGNKRTPKNIEMHANGILTIKIYCQLVYSKITPAIVGPKAGPIHAATDQRLIANACFSASKVS